MDAHDLLAGAGDHGSARRRGRPRRPLPEDPGRDPRAAEAGASGTSSCPTSATGPGLTNWEYGLLCEEMGRSPAAAPMAFNCSAPDTGNMEILAEHGTDEQKERWLEPLLEGRIRSCFSMTEPEVSGSDPTLLQARAVRDGDEWVIDGHKWFTSGAVGADLAIAMVVTDPEAPPLRARLDDLRPDRRPGLQPRPPDPGDGARNGPGHCEIRYEDAACRRATCSASEEGGSPRPGPARPGPHPPLHAGDRHGGAGAGDDVPPRHSAKPSAGRWATSSSSRRRSPPRGWRSTRRAC